MVLSQEMIEIFQYQELFINISNIDGIFGQRFYYFMTISI